MNTNDIKLYDFIKKNSLNNNNNIQKLREQNISKIFLIKDNGKLTLYNNLIFNDDYVYI